MAVSVIASMTLGIVVDDTIHWLEKFLHARRDEGMNAIGAKLSILANNVAFQPNL
jgi:predicted RND superfamily exporter protein